MAASKSTPRTAVEIADDIDDAIARVRAIHRFTCLGAAFDDESVGIGWPETEDYAALRRVVGDLLDGIGRDADALREAANAADQARIAALMRVEFAKLDAVNQSGAPS